MGVDVVTGAAVVAGAGVVVGATVVVGCGRAVVVVAERKRSVVGRLGATVVVGGASASSWGAIGVGTTISVKGLRGGVSIGKRSGLDATGAAAIGAGGSVVVGAGVVGGGLVGGTGTFGSRGARSGVERRAGLSTGAASNTERRPERPGCGAGAGGISGTGAGADRTGAGAGTGGSMLGSTGSRLGLVRVVLRGSIRGEDT